MFVMAANFPEQGNRILVVEDEAEIRELILILLSRQGYQVSQSASVPEALQQLKSNQFGLVILDWMLPQLSGIDFLKMLPPAKNKPAVLMLTAKAEAQDIVQGLEAGADDYLTKPFEPAVLIARIKALLRRQPQNLKEEISFGKLQINPATFKVRRDSQELHLTLSEFKILLEMALHRGKVLTREHLVKIVQGEGVSVTERTVDTHVFGLRKKLDAEADWIETIRGVGYRVRAE
jgi:two-component system, OmpR family, phosphate regulon response regulator PhoB